jgi:hypothetical protein
MFSMCYGKVATQLRMECGFYATMPPVRLRFGEDFCSSVANYNSSLLYFIGMIYCFFVVSEGGVG